ncbi:MAG: hypothetical protein QOD66_140 [Solirubrobacteraceae bacterium]|jgi:membrane-associated phospholipid phosphatase|nr:hypothetical protein [Solirubrobacteraceae bacterium]
MGSRVRTIGARVLPRGGRDALRQLFLVIAAYAVYEGVRALAYGSAYSPGYKPFGDAMKIIDLERALHVFIEPSVQAWVVNKHWLTDIASWIYLNAHDFVTLGVLVFIYLRHNERFYFVRNVFMVAMGIALVAYAIYPTAPPRLMGEWGFTDTIQQFTGITVEKGPSSALLNLYAAVPSMHVCFAMLVGGSMSRLVRRRALKLLWWLYPLLITFVVIATGNHYLTDVVLGGLTAAAAWLLADRLLARARPDAWAFGQAAA